MVADVQAQRAAIESVDDPVTLLGLRPVAVASLWENVIGSLDCGTADEVTVVHPSWWSPARVAVIHSAAETLVGVVQIRPRSWLLTRAVPARSDLATVVVEIADDLVVVTGAAVQAESRRRDAGAVAEAVAAAVCANVSEPPETVVIDVPATVRDAVSLAGAIAHRLPDSYRLKVVVVDDIRLRTLVGKLKSTAAEATFDAPTSRRRHRVPVIMMVLTASVAIGVAAVHGHGEPRSDDHFPTTFAVEGHVALEVPSQWLMQRVIAGPGSARVQITSPTDREVALHVTQSRVALPGLEATAEFLKSAIDAEPAGVFVDFNPSDHRGGHPDVTYREIRTGHDIRWTVWVDRTVRISIGCQSRNGRDSAVDQECDLAVRSARVVD